MIEKTALRSERVRKLSGGFCFIEHRFLRDGFFASLSHHELILYFFLVLVGDRFGLSYYSYDKICILLRISVDEYILARNALIEKDLLAFDGYLFQVLSLPDKGRLTRPVSIEAMCQHDPATIRQIILEAVGNGNKRDRDRATDSQL